MSWMNRYEIKESLMWAEEGTNVEAAAWTLYRLMQWTDNNSDGWPYWNKPSNAAKRLMAELQRVKTEGRRDRIYDDITDADLKKAYTPIKSFLTRQGVAHSEVFE